MKTETTKTETARKLTSGQILISAFLLSLLFSGASCAVRNSYTLEIYLKAGAPVVAAFTAYYLNAHYWLECSMSKRAFKSIGYALAVGALAIVLGPLVSTAMYGVAGFFSGLICGA